MSDVIGFDKFLTSLTSETITAIRAAYPTHVVDQLDAASRDSINATRLAYRAGGQQQIEESLNDWSEFPEWIRLQLADTFLAWSEGTGTTCLHDPTPQRPQPVIAAAWRPRLVVCGACTHLLRCTGAADRTCDGCGRVVAGLDQGDPMRTITVMFSALAFQVGVCHDCTPPNCGDPMPDDLPDRILDRLNQERHDDR